MTLLIFDTQRGEWIDLDALEESADDGQRETSSASERYQVRAKNFGELFANYAAQFDRDRHAKAVTQKASAETPLHPNRCGPCEDCREALADYATIPAYAERLEEKQLPPQLPPDDETSKVVTSVISRRSRRRRAKPMGKRPKTQKLLEEG
jgi:hypothetical protein